MKNIFELADGAHIDLRRIVWLSPPRKTFWRREVIAIECSAMVSGVEEALTLFLAIPEAPLPSVGLATDALEDEGQKKYNDLVALWEATTRQ